MKRISRTTVVILFVVWTVAIALRLQNFSLPPIDAHALRQTDTESVAYYFAFKNPNLLYPQASLIRPQTNTEGVFFLEFPAYQYGLGMLYRVFGSGIAVARLYNLAIFTACFLLLFRFVKRTWNESLALWSVTVFSVIPSAIFFMGHAIHPDIFAMLTMLTVVELMSHMRRRALGAICAALAFGLAVGTRPFILMALPTVFILMWIKRAKWWEYAIILAGSIGIYGFWTYWQTLFPDADHSWQFWTLAGQDQVFKFESLKLLAWRNVSGEVMGRVGSALAVLGLLAASINSLSWVVSKRKTLQKVLSKPMVYINAIKYGGERLSSETQLLLFCIPWLLAVPVYWYVAPAGNMFHQYYANVFVLPIILLAAYGADKITLIVKQKFVRILLAALIFVALLYNGYRTSSYFFSNKIPQAYVHIGEDIAKGVPVGAKIVYLATSNSVPFSLAHRQGWILGAPTTDVGSTTQEVLDMKKYGAEYAVKGKQNVDLSESELLLLEKETTVVYDSEWVRVFKFK